MISKFLTFRCLQTFLEEEAMTEVASDFRLLAIWYDYQTEISRDIDRDRLFFSVLDTVENVKKKPKTRLRKLDLNFNYVALKNTNSWHKRVKN